MCQNKGNNMFNFPLRRCLGQRKDLVVIPAYCILLSRERRVSQYHSWDSAKTEPSGSRTRDTGGWSPGTHRNTDLRTGQGHLGTGLRDTAAPPSGVTVAQSTAVVRAVHRILFILVITLIGINRCPACQSSCHPLVLEGGDGALLLHGHLLHHRSVRVRRARWTWPPRSW